MAIMPRALVNEAKIQTDVERAIAALSPDVMRIRYSLKEDWNGSPAIYFRMVVTDAASRGKRLHEVGKRVRTTLENEVDPLEMGLNSYFNFRTVSEHKEMKEKAWA